jgi:hypothetical protein
VGNGTRAGGRAGGAGACGDVAQAGGLAGGRRGKNGVYFGGVRLGGCKPTSRKGWRFRTVSGFVTVVLSLAQCRCAGRGGVFCALTVQSSGVVLQSRQGGLGAGWWCDGVAEERGNLEPLRARWQWGEASQVQPV